MVGWGRGKGADTARRRTRIFPLAREPKSRRCRRASLLRQAPSGPHQACSTHRCRAPRPGAPACGRGRSPPRPPARSSAARRWRRPPAPQRPAARPPPHKTAHEAAGPARTREARAGAAGCGGVRHAKRRKRANGQTRARARARRTCAAAGAGWPGPAGPAAALQRPPASLGLPMLPAGRVLTFRNSGRSSPRAQATGAGGGGAAAPVSPLMAPRARAPRRGWSQHSLRPSGGGRGPVRGRRARGGVSGASRGCVAAPAAPALPELRGALRSAAEPPGTRREEPAPAAPEACGGGSRPGPTAPLPL